MLEVRSKTSNRKPRLGLAGGKAQIEMVELSGFEPLTSSLPAKRSPN